MTAVGSVAKSERVIRSLPEARLICTSIPMARSVAGTPRLRSSRRSNEASLASISEWEALSLRMSQTSGPNDAMFFVVARENRAACNYYNGKRYVNSDCVAVQLGFRYNGYQWGSWQTVGWNTTCGESGYWNGSTTGCQSSGAVFVR